MDPNTWTCQFWLTSKNLFTSALCVDTGCNLEDLLVAMNDRDKRRERIREICAVSAFLMMMMMMISCRDKKRVLNITLNCIHYWVSSSGALESVTYTFISITSQSTLTQVVVAVRVPSTGEMNQFKDCFYLIGPCAKTTSKPFLWVIEFHGHFHNVNYPPKNKIDSKFARVSMTFWSHWGCIYFSHHEERFFSNLWGKSAFRS